MTPVLSSAADCEIGGIRWWIDPAVPVSVARPVLEAVLARVHAGAPGHRRGGRKRLYRIAGPGPDDAWLLKRNTYPPRRRRLRVSKARRELAVGAGLRARGIEAAVPLAAGEVHRGGRLVSCHLVVPLLAGFQDLERALTGPDAPRRLRSRWIEGLALAARRCHDAGLLQQDFAPNNFLVHAAEPGRVLPVDFERARLARPAGRRARQRMLAKLERHLAAASAADRMRFLDAYHGGDRREVRRWWRRLEREGARLAARDRTRLRRRAVRDGRRFETVHWGEWTGWAVREAPELAAAAARLDTGPAPIPASQALAVDPDGGLWCGRGNRSRREAAELWARALTLWTRGGACPRPIACVVRGDEIRFWWARDPGERTLLQLAASPQARAAAAVLVDRLQRLGRLDPWLSPRKLALARRPDGGLRAHLLDPEAFRPGSPRRSRSPRRGAAFVAERLREVEGRVAELTGTAP